MIAIRVILSAVCLAAVISLATGTTYLTSLAIVTLVFIAALASM